MKMIIDADLTPKLIVHLKSDDFFGVEKFPVTKLFITGSDSFKEGSALTGLKDYSIRSIEYLFITS